MIQDVLVEPLKVFKDERGSVMHMLRKDAPFFKQFGEVYFSTVNSGVIKGWKKHKAQTQHFAVPFGELKLVLFDDREGSPTNGEVNEFELGEKNYSLIRIPAGVWYSFKAVSTTHALIANCTDIVHDSGDCLQKDINDPSITFSWNKS